MTDLELTKACAERIGLTVSIDARNDAAGVVMARAGAQFAQRYNPLHNKAQVMDMVEEFRLDINQAHLAADAPWWRVSYRNVVGVSDRDLLRAVVECVAKIPKTA